LIQAVSQSLLNWVGRMVGQINHHLYRKRGFYYFCRRVPKALLAHYAKPRIVHDIHQIAVETPYNDKAIITVIVAMRRLIYLLLIMINKSASYAEDTNCDIIHDTINNFADYTRITSKQNNIEDCKYGVELSAE